MIDIIAGFLWGKVLIVALLGIGILLTITSRFVQFRYFGKMFKEVIRSFGAKGNGRLSSFQSLTMTLAGRVGAGNIAGVAVAITLGGPGAIFWMWVVGIMGMAVSFFECSHAQLFKHTEKDGAFVGGPAYYMQKGLKMKSLGLVFSVFLALQGFAFVAFQSNVVAVSLESAMGVEPLVTGGLVAVLLGIIIFGGAKRIANAAQVIVPVMSVGYVILATIVIIGNLEAIPGVFALIFKSAFGLEQAFGGGIGAALMHGIKRGLFSNEAGLGTAPNAAALAEVDHPASQGLVQAASVFVDTLILCTATACIILLSDTYLSGTDLNGAVLTQTAMAEHIGSWGEKFISIALVFFAFTSAMASYYSAEVGTKYVLPENKASLVVIRVIAIILAALGSMQDLGTAFFFIDLTGALSAVTNIAALALLYKVGMRLLADYDLQIDKGVQFPVLNPEDYKDLDIDQEAWGKKKEEYDSFETKPQLN